MAAIKWIFVNSDGLYEEEEGYSAADLGSTSNALGASLIGIEDASSYYTGTDIEAALNELEAQLGGATSTTFGFAEDNVLADNDAVYAALDKLDLKWGDLASTANGEGASLVGVEDSAGYFTGTDVEAVLAELYGNITDGVDYTTTCSKGDMLYVSGNDAASVYSTLSAAERVIGVAASNATASSVKVLGNDTVCAGILAGATAGQEYYWDGSALQTTMDGTSGNHVWQAGVAKNATDLHVQIRYIKKNA